jgi:hypothetical protein
MANREDQLLDQRHEELLAAIKGVHERLDTLNGRTRTLETRTAVLEERTPAGKIASGVSALVSGLISGIGLWLSSRQ